MRAATLLTHLRKPQIKSIAEHYGIDSGGNVDALIERIARSLPKRKTVDGDTLGWMGAVSALVSCMTKSEVLSIIRDNIWEDDGIAFVNTGALGPRSTEDLRVMLQGLCLGTDSEGNRLVDVCRDPRFAECFRETTGSDDEDADDDCEAPDSFEDFDSFGSEAPSSSSPLSEIYVTAGQGTSASYGHAPKPLLAHQERAITSLRSWWRDATPGGVLCLPTGAGKTRTAVSFIVRDVLPAGGRVLWLAHRTELVQQCLDTFAQEGSATPGRFELGRFEAQPRRVSRPVDVVVASIPTLAYHASSLPNLTSLLNIEKRFDLVIVDECHHAAAKTWKQILTALIKKGAAKKLLGLSATPTRTDEREASQLWRIFGSIVHEEPTLQLIRARVLARPRIVCVATKKRFEATASEQSLFEQFNDLPPKLVSRIANDAGRNRLVVETFLRGRERWGTSLFFAATIVQAHGLFAALSPIVPTGVVDGTMDDATRERAIGDFKDGRLKVLINVALFTEGTDLPKVDSVFVARPTQSRVLFQQMVGRGLRGPAMGGTDECNIVIFYDELVGLMQEQLGSTFASEAAALEALGLEDAAGEGGEGATSPESRGPLESQRDDLRERLDELWRLVRQHTPLARARDVAGVPLVGWWELPGALPPFYLPVFQSDRTTLQARMVQIAAAITSRQALPRAGWSNSLTYLDEGRFGMFATTAAEQRICPHEVLLDGATTAAVERFLDAFVAAEDWSAPPSHVVVPPVVVPESLAGEFIEGGSAARPPKGPLTPAAMSASNAKTLQLPAFPDMSPKAPIASPVGSSAAPPDTTPQVTAAALPAIAGHREAFISLPEGLFAIAHADLEALLTVWNRNSELVSGTTNPVGLQMFVAMASRMPELADVTPELSHRVLMAAAEAGRFPDQIDVLAPPSYAEVHLELQHAQREARSALARALYEKHFAHRGQSFEAFLLDLVSA